MRISDWSSDVCSSDLRAVIGRPSLLLADEPTGNLDDRMAVRLLYHFEELNKIGTTVVIATHNESLVQRFPHPVTRSEEHTSELQSLMRISYTALCLQNKKYAHIINYNNYIHAHKH